MHKSTRYDYPVNSFTEGNFTDLLQFKLPDAKCFKSDPFSQSNVIYQAYHSDALLTISYGSTLCDEVLLKDFMTIDHLVHPSPLSLLDDLVTLVSVALNQHISHCDYFDFHVEETFVDHTSYLNQKQGTIGANHNGDDSVQESILLSYVSSLDQYTDSPLPFKRGWHGPGSVCIRYSNLGNETYMHGLTELSDNESYADILNLNSTFQYSFNMDLESNATTEQLDWIAICRSLAKPKSVGNHPDPWVFSAKMEEI
jgi:hypothetical protein